MPSLKVRRTGFYMTYRCNILIVCNCNPAKQRIIVVPSEAENFPGMARPNSREHGKTTENPCELRTERMIMCVLE